MTDLTGMWDCNIYVFEMRSAELVGVDRMIFTA
jgi:hypothetical protein